MKGRFLSKICTVTQEAVFYIHSHGVNQKRTDLIKYAGVGPFRHSQQESWIVNARPVDDPVILAHQIASVPRYERFSSSILGRLPRFIISESEIQGTIAKEEYLTFMLTGVKPEDKPKKLIDVDPNEVPVTEEELKTFFNVWINDPNGFRPIQLERYFDRDPVETILGEKHPLKVSMSLSHRNVYAPIREKRDKMEDHDQVALYEWLKQAFANPDNVPDIPRRNLADDDILIDQIGIHDNRQHLFVVSDDKRLVREIAKRRFLKNSRLRTYRIPVIDWLASKCSYKVFECNIMEWNNVEIDLGSYEAKMAQLNIHGVSNFSVYDKEENTVGNILPGEKYKPVKVYKGSFTGTPMAFPLPNVPGRYLVHDFRV